MPQRNVWCWVHISRASQAIAEGNTSSPVKKKCNLKKQYNRLRCLNAALQVKLHLFFDLGGGEWRYPLIYAAADKWYPLTFGSVRCSEMPASFHLPAFRLDSHSTPFLASLSRVKLSVAASSKGDRREYVDTEAFSHLFPLSWVQSIIQKANTQGTVWIHMPQNQNLRISRCGGCPWMFVPSLSQ